MCYVIAADVHSELLKTARKHGHEPIVFSNCGNGRSVLILWINASFCKEISRLLVGEFGQFDQQLDIEELDSEGFVTMESRDFLEKSIAYADEGSQAHYQFYLFHGGDGS